MEELKINDFVKITMKNNAVIAGRLIALGKKLSNSEEHNFYQISVLDDRDITVFDVQMKAIEKIYSQDELQDMVIAIAEKYGIPSEEDSDDKNKLASCLIGIVGHWIELTDEEKKMVSTFLGNPEWCSVVLRMANSYFACYINALSDLQECMTKLAEKEKEEQDKAKCGLMGFYPVNVKTTPWSLHDFSWYGKKEW